MKYFSLIHAALALLILTACDRESDNLWYEKSSLDPESWAPANLQIENVSITEKKLTWSYGNHNIEGFKIDRKKGDGQWQESYATLSKEARSWNDTDIIPDQLLYYIYRLYAYAGTFNSDNIKAIYMIWEKCGDEVAFIYNKEPVFYGTVEGQNGTCWMDRNLGALRVATQSNDREAYGDLFQWGRGDDGHQLRNSNTTHIRSSSDNPGHSSFITQTSSPYDWLNPQNDNLWQGDGGINDVCPAGWRLPTETELDNERLSWNGNTFYAAFASPLKLVPAGGRFTDGFIYGIGSYGQYWTSSVSGSDARHLDIRNNPASIRNISRVYGMSVRCIRDD